MRVINDPLGQTHSPANNDHYSSLNFVLFCEIFKIGDRLTDGRTDRQTDNSKNSDHYRRECGSASWIKKRESNCKEV